MRGTTEDGTPVSLEFDVAKISRPLASAAELMAKNNRIVLDNDESYIESKENGSWVPLRREGNLFFLDMWVHSARCVDPCSALTVMVNRFVLIPPPECLALRAPLLCRIMSQGSPS